ncbi:MAG: M20 family metallopeptidase [marine benthic group bacterium]|nr:M20 family metallopeptidase [Gemmatimonadota bacterium]
MRPVSPTVESQLLEFLSDRREEMAEFLATLVTSESPTLEPEAQEPTQRSLAGKLESLGMRVRKFAGRKSGGMLLAVPADRTRRLPMQMLIGHSDTVWPIGTITEMPVRREDGRLYGPGAFDMKGGLVEIVYALEAIRSTAARLQVTPVVLINSDEETGSHDSRRLIERLARIADRAFVLEPGLGPAGQLKTARKGNGHFHLKVHGRAAHAGVEPEKGASAILELSLCIQQLFALNDPERGISVNVGTIDGGMRTNVVAPVSQATIDVRVLHAEDGPRVTEAIRSLQPTTPGTELEVTGGMDRLPLEKTPRNRRLWERALDAADRLGIEISEGTSGGGSDGNLTSLHCATLDGLGPVGDGAHAVHEHVVVDSLPERAALLACLMLGPPLIDERSSTHEIPRNSAIAAGASGGAPTPAS